MPERIWLQHFRLGWHSTYIREALKREQIRLPKFGSHEAFEMGTLTKNLTKEEFPNESVVIDVSLPNGNCLFRIATNLGSPQDDDNWHKRNRETVMRFRHSSFSIGLVLRKLMKSDEQEFFMDFEEHMFDGGAVPIFTDSYEQPVACLTVSGLEYFENHWIAVESVREYAIKIRDSVGEHTDQKEHIDQEEHTIDCAICLSEVQIDLDYRVTSCKHTFHRQCLQKWISRNPQCPLCRSPIYH